MGAKYFLDLADRILDGNKISLETYREIAHLPEKKVFSLLPGADRLREACFGHGVHLCTIVNGKSGKCGEDCAFCAQSKVSKAEVAAFPLLSREKLVAGVRHVETTSIHRFSIVTSGGRLPSDEIRELAGTLSEHSSPRPKLCVSLGLLEEKDFALLKRADVSRYHHNLETARSHFSSICSTHTYEERITVIRRAKAQGLSICCGGIFGIGESDDQILEFACELRNLEADAIPINFLTPIKGTPLEKAAFLNPLKCLKIIALFRFVLPDREIIICGGRENNLRELHPLIFFAGASGIMTGHYLTTEGRQLGNDLELLADLNFYPR